MGISVKNRKILWTRAGNQCAFPGCRQELVEKVQDVGPDIVVGEEAHIVPRNRKGPRGCEPIPQEGVDSYTNIILFCPTHHNIVDSAPDIYTKQCIIDMKSAHEQRVRFNQLSDRCLLKVAATVPRAIGQAVNCWQIGGSIVVIYSYGSPPVRLDHDHWRAVSELANCMPQKMSTGYSIVPKQSLISSTGLRTPSFMLFKRHFYTTKIALHLS